MRITELLKKERKLKQHLNLKLSHLLQLQY